MEGSFVGINEVVWGWRIVVKKVQVIRRITSQGSGFSWGMSLWGVGSCWSPCSSLKG